MRFVVVTLCFMFMAVAAHAEIGIEPYEYFGFHLGDSEEAVLHVLETSEKLGAHNLYGGSLPNNKSEVSASINQFGYNFIRLHLFFTNDKLTAILVSTGTKYERMCEFAEYTFKCKPSYVVDRDRTVFNIRKGLTVSIMYVGDGWGSAFADVFYTANANEIPEYELAYYERARNLDYRNKKKK